MQKKGFTLIELLVVIAIIGILAAIGVTAFGGAQSKARDSKRKADLGALAASLTLYYDGNSGAYPLNTTATTAALATNLQTASADVTNGFSVPKSPQTANNGDYYYITDAAGTRMALFSLMENAQATTNYRWFVNNSRGYSDFGAGTTNFAANPNTADCALSAGSGTLHPCYPTPSM